MSAAATLPSLESFSPVFQRAAGKYGPGPIRQGVLSDSPIGGNCGFFSQNSVNVEVDALRPALFDFLNALLFEKGFRLRAETETQFIAGHV